MSREPIKMNSISQFRNTIQDIRHNAQFVEMNLETNTPIIDRLAKMPTVCFAGSVKLHGTNASICYDGTDLWAQSKENILTLEKDNYGFAFFVESNKDYLTNVLQGYLDEDKTIDTICVYGEWAGKGIQKNVAISQIEKKFYMFGIKYKYTDFEDHVWDKDPDLKLHRISDRARILSLLDFETYFISIDFENPSEAQNTMIELVNGIDKQCPIGEDFNVTGHGEGIVWVGYYKDQRYTFKTKGENHSKTKVKVLTPVDEEKEQAKREFANYACKADRLEQAWDKTFDIGGENITPTIALTGTFMRAVISDITKEETDVMNDMKLEPKEVNKYISVVARRWFMEQLDKEILN